MPGEFVPRGYLAWLRSWIEDQRYIGPVLWKLEEAPSTLTTSLIQPSIQIRKDKRLLLAREVQQSARPGVLHPRPSPRRRCSDHSVADQA